MNVLVYSGPGTTPESVKHCLESLRRFLSPYYSVIGVDAKMIKTEPWMGKSSLLVIPGGADVPICREFNGRGNQIIREFVRKGGKLLGFCSGGYYGSAICEFEVGDPMMEVSGARELKLFPGIARGCAFKGFQYGSEQGSRAVAVQVNKQALGIDLDTSHHYYNGGGVFVDAGKYENVTVLANYCEEVEVDCGDGSAAAVVLCEYGKGAAILTGTHPEFVPEMMHQHQDDDKHYMDIVNHLAAHNESRSQFLRACLIKLGLRVNDGEVVRPRLTPLTLSSPIPGAVSKVVNDLVANVGLVDGDLLQGASDTFRLHKGEEAGFTTQLEKQEEFEDPDTAIKELYAFTDSIPDRKLTSFFDIKQYFRYLQQDYGSLDTVKVGSILIYGEVVTSTNTMVDKNLSILQNIPSGLVLAASNQVSGRGRGGNLWINPYGVLASSLVLDLPLSYTHAPVVFVQYLTALAMVKAVKSMGPGYEELPIRLKWPNDLYIMKSEYLGKEIVVDTEPAYVKIGGTLVNTNVIDGNYKCVIGTGINLSNSAPTTSINSIINTLNEIRTKRGQHKLDALSSEIVLAKYMFFIGKFFEQFKQFGFKPLLPLYYEEWLHTNQIVLLKDHGAIRAKITGITDDFGLLIAKEVDRDDKQTGAIYHLQPDGNSFDMFNGLISKKTTT